MNYLAHAYLSYHDPAIMTGNFIADFVKGKNWMKFSPAIQQGILLHRAIDEFTDHHKATLAAKEFFKPVVGLYSGVFTDILFDHFLANDATRFPGKELQEFAQEAYNVLNTHQPILPAAFERIFFYMQRENWLVGYGTRQGIFQTFKGVSRRAKYLTVPPEKTFAVFEANYYALGDHYKMLFPEMEDFVKIYASQHFSK